MVSELAKFISICVAVTAAVLMGCSIVVFCSLNILDRSFREENAVHARLQLPDSQPRSKAEKSTPTYERFLPAELEVAEANKKWREQLATTRAQDNAQIEEATRQRIAGYEEARLQIDLIRRRIDSTTLESKQQQTASSSRVEQAAERYEQSLRSRKVSAQKFGVRSSGRGGSIGEEYRSVGGPRARRHPGNSHPEN